MRRTEERGGRNAAVARARWGASPRAKVWTSGTARGVGARIEPPSLEGAITPDSPGSVLAGQHPDPARSPDCVSQQACGSATVVGAFPVATIAALGEQGQGTHWPVTRTRSATTAA
jgi:hypothetical protein